MNVCAEAIDPQDLNAMEALIDYLKKYKRAFFYMNVPQIPQELKLNVFTQLCAYFNLSGCFNRLVKLLLQHKRIYLLPDVLEYILRAYKEKMGTIDFTIASSHELTDTEKEFFINFLTRKTGKKINYKVILDPSLIMGVKLFSRTLSWEYSIRQKLISLQRV